MYYFVKVCVKNILKKGHKHGKVCQPETLVFLETIHKLYFNVLNPGILFKSMINNYNFFDFIAYYWRNKCFNMHLSTFFWIASRESTCYNSTKLSYKYMKIQHQLKLLYFQVDDDLMCMDMVSTFHYLVIIYQSFNVKMFWKIWKTNQFRQYFSSIFYI